MTPNPKQKNNRWCTMSSGAVVDYLDSHDSGLTSTEVNVRLELHGPNQLPQPEKDTLISLFLRQFKSPLLYILVAAALVALGLGEITDGLIILAVLVLNGVVGAFQEGKAQNALFALQKFATTESLVIRDGKNTIIPSEDLVPGDIIILKEGDKIPADARLITVQNLSTNEAVLTGESTPVQKNTEIVESEAEVVISDQTNMVFKGTHISRGNARAIVVATGLGTEIGKISENIQGVQSEIPLQKSIRNLARGIIIVTTVVILLLFVFGLSTGNTFREMLLVAISLMVSVIPEGLPIVMTLILARGVKRMSEQNALVKRLQAVEALGQATIIAVDKTGTLTKNELVIQKIFVDNQVYDVTGVGYELVGDVMRGSDIVTKDSHVQHLARIVGRSANAQIFRDDEHDEVKLTGDPTEAAMLVFGEKITGKEKSDFIAETPLVAELPFDYKKKYYASLFKDGSDFHMIVTGAPEVLAPQAIHIKSDNGERPMTDQDHEQIQAQVHKFSEQGLRVIAVAERRMSDQQMNDDDVSHLTLVGLVAMKDALRPEVAHAMTQAHRAGMRVVMITGDHMVTARAIASEAGVFHDGDEVLTGPEILEMTEEELAHRLDKVSVFARVTPEHKLRIVEAYKQRGDIIAMTGDGVNDVPPLIAANLGVAMGKIGTEVTKEAADIVLLDDNFGTISVAVEEGRNIYGTIKKTLLYLFSTNLAELMVIAFAVIILLPLPLTPAQIVWLNLVTDSFLVMTLAFLPRDPSVLHGRMKKLSRYILDKRDTIRLVLFSLIITAGTLIAFFLYRSSGVAIARTMTFVTLSLFQIFRLWSVRSDTESAFAHNPFKAPWMLGASCIAIGLQVFAIYTPFMQNILETAPLSPIDWLVATGIGFSIVIVDEIRKIVVRSRQDKK